MTAERERHEAKMMDELRREGAVCLFFPGRLIADLKGQDIAIRSVAMLVERGLNIRLFFGGSGKDQRYLEELSRKLRIEDHVYFLGNLTHERMMGYMGCADIVLTHLAVDARLEGLSQVHLEAAALSKPIITQFRDDLAIFNEAMLFANTGEPEEIAKLILRNHGKQT